VRLVGVDASRQELDDLEDDSTQALVVRKPAEIGRLGVEQALAALEGRRPEPRIAVGFVVVTADNADDPRIARWLYAAQCKDG
jgi:ribose transport system substrate-binding protein